MKIKFFLNEPICRDDTILNTRQKYFQKHLYSSNNYECPPRRNESPGMYAHILYCAVYMLLTYIYIYIYIYINCRRSRVTFGISYYNIYAFIYGCTRRAPKYTCAWDIYIILYKYRYVGTCSDGFGPTVV